MQTSHMTVKISADTTEFERAMERARQVHQAINPARRTWGLDWLRWRLERPRYDSRGWERSRDVWLARRPRKRRV